MRFLAILAALFSFPAWAADYYAAPGGGASASCVDSSTNVCTVARCISVAATGDTCNLTPGTYPGSELGGSGYVIETSELVNLVCSGAKWSCIFQPSGTNVSAVRFNTPTAGGTVNITGIWFDGAVATPMDQCVWASDASAIYSVVATDTKCTEPAIYDFRIVANEINLTSTRNDMSASSAVTPTHYIGFVGTWAEGSLTADGGDVYIAKYNGESPSAIIRATAADAGEAASIKNLNITVINDPAKTSKNLDVITITNIANAVVDGNTIRVTGANVGSTGASCDSSACRTVRVARCYSTIASTSDNCAITNNTVTVEAANGQMLAVGYDQTGLGDTYSTNGTISGNTVTCTNSGTSIHGAGVFWSQGGRVLQNKITNCGIALLSKDQPTAGADFAGNIVWGAWEEYAYSKGSTAPRFLSNDFIITNTAGTPLVAGKDGAANSTNVVFKANLIWSPNGYTPTDLVNTASSQTIAAGGVDQNDWYGFSAYQWTYLGSAYTSLASWNALAIVGTDLSTAPLTISSSPVRSEDLITRSTSPLLRAATCYLATGCVYPDFRGYRARVPPDIGAYQRRASDP